MIDRWLIAVCAHEKEFGPRKRIADGSFFGGWNPLQKEPKKYGSSPIDGGLLDCHGMFGKMEGVGVSC